MDKNKAPSKSSSFRRWEKLQEKVKHKLWDDASTLAFVMLFNAVFLAIAMTILGILSLHISIDSLEAKVLLIWLGMGVIFVSIDLFMVILEVEIITAIKYLKHRKH